MNSLMRSGCRLILARQLDCIIIARQAIFHLTVACSDLDRVYTWRGIFHLIVPGFDLDRVYTR